ncbi:hypothetical protein ONS96_009343 [Cadophora gregata f. sp. sojae]|nr:hypothetical protein ONS96_009343 [Cadophora gregata f. sp. sojae]
MASPSTPAHEGYETRSMPHTIGEEGDDESNPMVISSDPVPEPTAHETLEKPQSRKSSLGDLMVQYLRARLELSPPIAIPAASAFNTADVIDASETIDQYICAFEISQDTYFLDQVRKVMDMVANGNPYVNGQRLTELYKFAYKHEIDEETVTEVIQSIGRSTKLQATGNEVRRLHELLQEAPVYLSVTKVKAYIEEGCSTLRQPQQTELSSINDLIRRLTKPALSEKGLRVTYEYLKVLRNCQELGFDTWGPTKQRPGTRTPKSESGENLQANQINKELDAARVGFNTSWGRKRKDKSDACFVRRLHLMGDSIRTSTETHRCLERRNAWEDFWDRMAKSDPTGEMPLLNNDSGYGTPERSEGPTENQHGLPETSNNGKMTASGMEE